MVLTGLLMLADLYLIFMVVPPGDYMGNLQRVLFFHVPIALTSFLAFFVVFLASITYLVRRNEKWDRIAHASAEVGVVFVSLALVTGMIWGRAVWFTWWTWEPRLTTTLILWLIYVSYLMIRSYAPTQAKAALYSAVVGIVGFVDVPIVYYSVIWWRSIHPLPVVGPFAEAKAVEDIIILITLLFSLVTFLTLFAYLAWERTVLRESEDQLRGVRLMLRRAARYRHAVAGAGIEQSG